MVDVDKNTSVKGKKRPGMPKRVKEMTKEQLQLELLKKKECNAKALQIVEHLLENSVTEEWFLNCLKFISDTHFQDVIEERAILKCCGYPLCHQRLKAVPNQQYRISTKVNKVYDITERKNFCSNHCYKAGKFIKDQLLTSPLWLRDKEEIPCFRVLPLNYSGIGAGEEVDIGQSNSTLKNEVTQLQSDGFTSVTQFAKDSLSSLSKRVDRLEKKEMKQRAKYNEKETDKNPSNPTVKEDKETNISENDAHLPATDVSVDIQSATDHLSALNIIGKHTDSSVTTVNINAQDNNNSKCIVKTASEINTKSSKNNIVVHESVAEQKSEQLNTCLNKSENKAKISENNECNPKSQKKERIKSRMKSKEKKESSSDISVLTTVVVHIEKCLHEWFTLDTMCFLFGEDKVKEMVKDKGECFKEYYKAVGGISKDAAIQERYEAICRRLNILELEENKYDMEVRQMKPLPDYTVLKEDSKFLELKVQAFYHGQTHFETLTNKQTKKQDEEGTESKMLPLLDPQALRRRIVLNRLNRVLPDLLRTFGLAPRDVTTDVRSLVCTFSLGPHNITFRPPEWSFLGLIIIKMLSIKDIHLKLALDMEQATKYQTMMLMAFHQDGGYLERLMAWLTDIDNLLLKQPITSRSS